MASPTHEIDLQTISLEDLVHNLTAKMEVLVDSISILSCKSSSEFDTNLKEMGQALDFQDEMTNEFKKRVDELHSHTSEIGELLQSVQEENRIYQHTLDTLPDIPGMKTVKTAKSNLGTVQAKEQVALSQINKKSSKASKRPSRIGIISEKDFDKTPSYLRGRMAYDKFSSLVDKLQSVVDEKYKIANLPLSKVPMSKLKLYHDFKDAETAYTKGGYFFVEEDINSLSNTLMDPAMRNALMILRHHHIIKEVSTKLKETLRLAGENAETRLTTEQKSISHARRVSKAQERSMSEEGKKKRKMDQLRQLTEDVESEYPVSSLSNRSGTPTTQKTSNSTDRKQSSASKHESKEINKDAPSTASSIVSSVASEDSSHTGATDDRGNLLTSISSFNKTGLKKTETEDHNTPKI